MGSKRGGGGEMSRLGFKSLTPSAPRKVSGVDTSSSLLEYGGGESAVVLCILASSAALWLVREVTTIAFACLVGCTPVALCALGPAVVDTTALAGFAVAMYPSCFFCPARAFHLWEEGVVAGIAASSRFAASLSTRVCWTIPAPAQVGYEQLVWSHDPAAEVDIYCSSPFSRLQGSPCNMFNAFWEQSEDA